MISLNVRGKSYGRKPILGPIKRDIDDGATVAISGPSGAGKSTLLRMIAGLDPNYSGHIETQGRLAMVFQKPALLPWLNTHDNIKVATGASSQRIESIIDQVGLSAQSAQYPHTLSLGQQRRVALARAFVNPPNVLLLDEPFTSLDPANVDLLLALLIQLIKAHRPTTLFVSHTVSEIERVADQHLVLHGVPATLQLSVPPVHMLLGT